MSKLKDILTPAGLRGINLIIYLFVSELCLVIGIANTHYLSKLANIGLLFTWMISFVIMVLWLTNKEERFQAHRRTILSVSHILLPLGVVLTIGSKLVHGEPPEKAFMFITGIALVFFLFFLISIGYYHWWERSEKKINALLQDRASISRRIFMPFTPTSARFLSPRRRRVYIAAGFLFGLVLTFTIIVLWSQKLYIQSAIVFAGFLIIQMLWESLVQAESTEKTSYEGELQAARIIQMGLMPAQDPVVTGFDISGRCAPANEVGGDFFDYIWLDEQKTKFGIALADVSGKALKAAMTAVMTSGMVYSAVNDSKSPREILMRLNRPMFHKTDRRIFTAMSFAVIDVKEMLLSFSNAGQMLPLLRRGDTLQAIKVEGVRLPLGVMENVEYNEVTLKLQSGDMLALFTDGIIEAKNKKEELWGLERMEETIRTMPLEKSAKEIVETLITEANSFAGTTKQYDDITVVVVKVL